MGLFGVGFALLPNKSFCMHYSTLAVNWLKWITELKLVIIEARNWESWYEVRTERQIAARPVYTNSSMHGLKQLVWSKQKRPSLWSYMHRDWKSLVYASSLRLMLYVNLDLNSQPGHSQKSWSSVMTVGRLLASIRPTVSVHGHA